LRKGGQRAECVFGASPDIRQRAPPSRVHTTVRRRSLRRGFVAMGPQAAPKPRAGGAGFGLSRATPAVGRWAGSFSMRRRPTPDLAARRDRLLIVACNTIGALLVWFALDGPPSSPKVGVGFVARARRVRRSGVSMGPRGWSATGANRAFRAAGARGWTPRMVIDPRPPNRRLVALHRVRARFLARIEGWRTKRARGGSPWLGGRHCANRFT
jgi:hypothetical protein